MSRIITIQPSAHTDNITEDGRELTRLPYPFHIEEDGAIGRQDFWQGTVARLVGFQRKLDVQAIDLGLREFLADPQKAVGMYAVTQDDEGNWAGHVNAISRVVVS